MVEEVEELGAELDAHSFANLSFLEDGEIKIVDSGSAKRWVNARFGARPKVWRVGKTGGVKPVGKAAAAGFLVASRNHIGPDVPHSKICRFQRSRAGVGNLQREAALECSDAINAPAGNHAVRDSVEVRCEPPAVSEGKVENVTDHQPLRNVLGGQRVFSLQVVPVLHAANSTGRPSEPAG